ncbi:MAG: glycosyltransferase family 2 protein [Bacillales bacterium]|nr:glycosyltransferase family 2 protein [Bacillales bacterium]
MDELVSIIMPSYNTGSFIADSINSVLNQTYKNWELIIVDDFSNDNTEDIVSSFKDSRIKFLKNECNSGAAFSRNRALREAKGRWIAFLDSDDLWSFDKLEKQINFMTANGYHFSYTKYEEIDEESNSLFIVISGPKKITEHGMRNYCWPGCLTVMYDANFIGLIQIANIKKNNDYAMWLKACKKTDCFLLDEVLGKYRKGRSGSISNHSYLSMIKWHYRLFKYAENENFFIAIYHTIGNLFYGVLKKKRYKKKINRRK